MTRTQNRAPAPQAKTNILLVDDQPANLIALEAVLEDLGQTTMRAYSGEQALRLVDEEDFAVIILDVQMHGLDGFETAKLIRSRERAKHTPIIFLTAFDSEAFPPARAYTLGAVDYLVKPIASEILRAKVLVFVELFLLRAAEQRAHRGHLATQYACARAMAEAATIRDAMPNVLQAVCQGLHWDWGALWTVAADGQTLRCAETWHAPDLDISRFESGSRHAEVPRGKGLPGRIWASGKPAWVKDVWEDSYHPRLVLAREEGLRSALGFPIRMGKEFLGVMEFLSRKVREPDEETLHLLATLGSQVGQFIHRKRAEEQLNDFVENASIGLHWLGADGKILWANQAELNLLGYGREEYIGRNIQDFHEDPAAMERVLRRLAGKEEVQSYEARLRCKDGSIRHVLISSNVLWEDGRFVHARGFTRDITDRVRAEEALREADRRKDEFLAMLAHELRNPLGPIRNGLHILRLRGTEWKTVEQVREMMDRQVGHMARLVDDLLDMSRITRGKVLLKKERLDLGRLVRLAIADVREEFESAGLSLYLEAPDTPVWVHADSTRLTQGLVNLLVNARKFVEPGGEVHVCLTADESTREARLSVRDTGIGIEPEMLTRLFDVFSQADRTLERSRGGLGLGLSIVKGLVELHGGRIRASSEGLGRGAEMTVWLPAVGESAALLDKPVSAPSPTGHLRVLLVEDNRDAADSLRMLLEFSGYKVTVAYSGAEGVKVAKEFRPDIIVCDIGLPGMDGFAVAKALRENPETAAARIIAVTGYGGEDDRQKALEAGFNTHLVKPVDPNKLLTNLGQAGS